MEAQSQPKYDLKAVALRYRPGMDESPQVAAKGRGHVAEKILELARDNKIPIRQDKDLVQVLSLLDLEEEIPPSLYKAVAEILAFIYRMNQGALKPR